MILLRPMAAHVGAGPFRGLAPYGEGDAQLFFGRDAESARVRELLADSEARAVLVSGEAGAGKTSLLHTVVVPAARSEDLRLLTLCVDLSQGWRESLRGAFASATGRALVGAAEPAKACLDAAAERGKKLLVVFDHLEQLMWLDPAAIEELNAFLGTIERAGPQGRLLLSVDRTQLHVLGRLRGAVQHRIPDEHRVELPRWDERHAAAVIEQIILGGGGYMEAGLPELIAKEICAVNPVLPAEVQRVCHAAVLERRLTQSEYRRGGGAEALSTLYVERLTRRAGGWRARRVLAILGEGDDPCVSVDAEEAGQRAGVPEANARALLDSLTEAGLLRRLATSDAKRPRYGVLHPYLWQPLRDAVAPVRRGRARARLDVRRRTDTGGLLWPHELLRVWWHLGSATSDRERATVEKSTRLWLLVAAVWLVLPLVVNLVLAARLAGQQYLGCMGSDCSDSVVVRSGDPSLRFAYGLAPAPLDQVEIDTGFTVESLPSDLQWRVREGEFAGKLQETTDSGLPAWLSPILEGLPETRRGALLILAGRSKQGAELLLRSAAQPAEREQAVRLLVLLTGDSPATRQALVECTKDERLSVRMMALEEAVRLSPESTVAVLRAAVADAHPQIRLAALRIARHIDSGRALDVLGHLLLDGDLRVCQGALRALDKASEGHPLQAADVILAAQAKLRQSGKHRCGVDVGEELARLLSRVQALAPKKLAAHLVDHVQNPAYAAQRAEILTALVARTDHVPASVATLVAPLLKDDDVRVKEAAVVLQARFGDAQESFERLRGLARTFDRAHGTRSAAMRRAAAKGLGAIRIAEDKDRIKVLEALLLDSMASVRRAAVASLLRSGFPGLRAVVERIKRNYPPDVGSLALDVVCAERKPDRKMATSVLAAAWETRMSQVRVRALRCAEALHRSNPRLTVWLADRASLDSNTSVRRAAAASVALAVERLGSRAARLPRFYLRDDDPTVRVAVLEALAERLPSKAAFLLRVVEPSTRSGDPGVRAAVAAVLGGVAFEASGALKLIERLLQDPDLRVGTAALRALRQMVRQLKEGKRKPSYRVAWSSLQQSLSDLIARADGSTAELAVDVAGRLGLLRPLLRAAGHRGPSVRAVAVKEVAQLAEPKQALRVLEAAQRDSVAAPRLAARLALVRYSERLGKDVVPLLASGIGAADLAEREAAFEALGRVSGEAIAPAVKTLQKIASDPSEQNRRLAMEALGQLAALSAEALRLLVEGAVDPARDVRTVARRALAKHLARQCSSEVLWRLLVESEDSALLRMIAARALAEQGRSSGTAWLDARVAKLGKDAPMNAGLGLRLARALATSDRPIEPVVSYLFGG